MELSSERSLSMVAGSFYIPKHNPSKPEGEDAHFINLEAQVIGVADGVGGWSKKGIDAGKYARELMCNVEGIIEACDYDQTIIFDPKDALVAAYYSTEAEGSSTACILEFKDELIWAANVGDSGFMVISKKGETVFKFEAQQHKFNYPYQLGDPYGDGPDKAEVIEVSVEEGDIVVVGTDGLFDNMFEDDIGNVVRKFVGKSKKLQPDRVAWALANEARRLSLQKDFGSPFDVGAYKSGIFHAGGKYDDITVVVAFIVSAYLDCFVIRLYNLYDFTKVLCV